MTPGFRDVLAFAWRHWRRHPLKLVLLAAALVGATVSEIMIPVAIGRLIDALNGEDGRAALLALATIAGFSALFHAFHKGGDYLWCRLAVATMRRIGADAFARVQRYSTDWHASTFAGKTVRNITRGIWAFDDFGDAFYLHLLPASAVVLGVVVVMTARWPLMGALFLVGTALYCALSVTLATMHISPRRRVAVDADSQLGGSIADAITCNAVVKATGAENREETRLTAVFDRWHAVMLRSWDASINTAVVQSLTLILIQVALVGTGLWLWQQGRASAGDIAFVLTSFLVVRGYLRDVGNEIRVIQQATNDLEDVVIYARTPPRIADRAGARPLAVERGEVRFEGVTFAYPGQPRPIFADMALTVRPGEKVALVGPSGSGKTSLVKLVQRLYEVDRGRILIDGQDIAAVTQASLRAAVALVPQDPVLFHRSLAENIAYARPGASDAEIERAARLAHAHDFVRRLPEGYDTLVGERGVKLSGGERQRVAIARAILADRPVLILDEATSSLDSVSEVAIQDALRSLMAGRTTIVIAHRLSTIRSVDRILVFERGRIVEEGTHAALLARDGRYAELYRTQALGFEAGPGEMPVAEPRTREDA